MNNLTKIFTEPYLPVKALVIYAEKKGTDDHYVESFDFDGNNRMINAHPLSLQEARNLGQIFIHEEAQNSNCFQSTGLIPENVLYTQTGCNGYVIWYTSSQRRNLYFTKDLGIPDGLYPIPPLLWMATREKLTLYAVRNVARPTISTPLFHAPFFNIHADSGVCMGTVDIEINPYADLEEFIGTWQQYFFNSKFSHLLSDRSPVKSNIVQLYHNLVASRKKYPLQELLPTGKKLKNLLHGNK